MTDSSFDFGWNAIGAESLAHYEGLLGSSAIKSDGIYWRRVRVGFYRPLVQFQEYQSGKVTLPPLARLGAAQYVVAAGGPSNSTLNCLFFENTSSYSRDSLDQNRNRQVRLAQKQFEIRPVADQEELKRQGHLAYTSFYERTRYDYGARRLNYDYFSDWVDALYQIPGLLILGAYQNRTLTGVSISFLVNDTACYASFFCTTAALKACLSDLMLHAVRTAASRQQGIARVFAGLWKGNDGLDRFYLLRGAKCVQKPAVLHINPVTRMCLRWCAPGMYSRMIGAFGNIPPSAGDDVLTSQRI